MLFYNLNQKTTNIACTYYLLLSLQMCNYLLTMQKIKGKVKSRQREGKSNQRKVWSLIVTQILELVTHFEYSFHKYQCD